LEHQPREKITLTLSRRGESREIQVTLGEATHEEGRTFPILLAVFAAAKLPQVRGALGKAMHEFR